MRKTLLFSFLSIPFLFGFGQNSLKSGNTLNNSAELQAKIGTVGSTSTEGLFNPIAFNGSNWDVGTNGVDEACSVSYTGTIQDGLGNLQSLIIANDFPVGVNVNFNLQRVTLKIFGNIGTATVRVFNNNAGVPGSVISTQAGITPTSQTLVGNAFGFNVYEVVLNLPTAVELNGGSAGSLFWVSVATTAGSEAVSNFWEKADTNTNAVAMVSSDNGATWTPNSFGQDSAFVVSGDCLTAGCLTTPNGQWPTTTFTPTCTGFAETITSSGWYGEYSRVNVTAGNTYVFTTNDPSAYITIADASGTTVLATGTYSTTWTAPSTQVVRFITHLDDDCNYSDDSITRMVKCGSIPVQSYPAFDCYKGDGLFASVIDGLNVTNGGVYVQADDFFVEEGTDFDMKQVRLNLLSQSAITNVSMKFYHDNAGTLGSLIQTVAMAPTSTRVVDMAFGFSVYEVTLDLATPINFTEGTYWFSPSVTNSANGQVYWEMNPSGTYGAIELTSSDSGATWTPNEYGYQASFFVSGDCDFLIDYCLTAPNGQYPSGNYTPVCLGSPETITSAAWTGEYSKVSVTAGTQYTFSSTISTDFITISDTNGLVPYVSGTGSLTWTAPANEVVRFYLHNGSDCSYENSSRSRIVQCGEPIVITEPDFPCFFGDGLASNGPEDGLNITQGISYSTADDFIVPAASTFTVQQVRINALALSPIGSTTLQFRNNASGLPGSTILHTVTMSPSSYRVVGSAFGYTLYECTFDLPTSYTFNEGTYWLAISTETSSYWESTSTGSTGAYSAMSQDGGATWATYTGANFNQVFFVAGECAVDEPDGCLDTPNGQYPSTTFTPACMGVAETITTLGWFGEYSVVSVTAGTEYTFSTDVPTAFITIANSTASTVLASGTGSVTWTAASSGTVRFITHENSDCLSSTNWVERYVQCGEPIVIGEPDFPCFFGDGLASNGPEDGLNITESVPFSTADDFIVPAGSTFTMKQVRMNVLALSPVSTTTLDFRNNASGLPGTTILHTVTMAPSSYRVIGGAFGYTLYECTFDLATPYTFNEGTYWMAVTSTTSGYWESTSTGSTGAYSAMSQDGGASWATYSDANFNQVFFVAGECDSVEAEECSVEYDGTFQDGIGNLQALLIANDFPVAANTEMKLQKVTLNIFGNISNASVYIFDNASGTPGSELAAFGPLTPDSQTLVGSAFGFNIYEVVLTIPTEVTLSGGTSGQLFWVGVMTSAGSENVSNFWEKADVNTNGIAMVSSDGGFTWTPNSFGQDSAFIVAGECSTLGMDDLTSFDFAYYPNPVKDVLNITSKQAVASVSVFNLAGQQVMNNAKVSNGQINVNALPAGTYVFKITLEGGQVETFKIIKK